jgi:subtilisin family serine protease
MVSTLAQEHRFTPLFYYEGCLKGFAASMDAATAEAIARNPRVESVEPDRVAHTCAQTIPPGISRIAATTSSTLAGNGSGSVNGVDVYVIDTGIQSTHPDLHVMGGANFNSGSSYQDGNGHGTHVSGTIGAIDNTSQVVGVAPGVDLYAVRVLSNSGSGSYSQILAGVNWVTNRKIASPSRPMCANMSLGGYTGSSAYNSLDNGIANSINRGVVYCIAAGNSTANAVNYSPAHVTQAITVGAYAASTNAWASFSNYGSIVDILAPGVNVLSTWKSSGTNTISGTSMATPHVCGTVALYLSTHPTATPADVQNALVADANAVKPSPNTAITGVPAATTTTSVWAGGY